MMPRTNPNNPSQRPAPTAQQQRPPLPPMPLEPTGTNAAGAEDMQVDRAAPQDQDIDGDEAEGEDEDGEEGEGEDSQETEKLEPFDTTHLKEIGNLASWTVSTAKPGCGVDALRSASTSQFWQSDGPQPHLLNIHFFKLVSIVALRVYLDYSADESYTPTKMSFLAGTGYHDLQEFVELAFEQPKGWIEVDLGGVNGGRGEEEDENVLRCFLLQVRVAENHQNGKDTHVRGVQIYAREEGERGRVRREEKGVQGLEMPEWMGEVMMR